MQSPETKDAPGELSPEAKAALSNEYVLVLKRDGSSALYTHEQFVGAFQESFLDRLDVTLKPGSTQRAAMRTIANLRTKREHAVVLAAALRKLCSNVRPADPEVLARGKVVARFPEPEDT